MEKLRNKVLITGGYGFIGYHLAKHLLNFGNKVILFGHRPSDMGRFKLLADQHPDIANGGSMMQCKYGELISDDLHQLAHEETDIAMVYHLAAIKSTTQTADKASASLLGHNFDCDLEIFDFCEHLVAAREASNMDTTVKLVYMSTGEVYGDMFQVGQEPLREGSWCALEPWKAGHLYPLSKVLGESMLNHGEWMFQWCVMRLQNPYGPYMGTDMLVPKIMHAACKAVDEGAAEFFVSAPMDTRPYVFVDDVAYALQAIMDLGRPKETYNFAGIDAVSVKMLAIMIQQMFAPGKLELKFADVKGGSRRDVDIGKFIAMPGFPPRVVLTEGLRRTFEWYSRRYAVDKSMRGMGVV